ncbi:MAG: DUF1254 domain-containing protein [Hyphomicrobiales bacterium]|nr:DUF1254 domain-containing protein [Hyphomicrobiales bacterium]
MSLRYLYMLMCGLILAGIVHISVILLIPNYGSRDAWNIISKKSDMWIFSNLSGSADRATGLENTDPYIKMGACTFNLDEAGLRLVGGKTTGFWSVSVFDQGGSVIYSLNNNTAINNKLNLIVLNPIQMITLRDSPAEEIEHAVIIEADIGKGFVVLRKFQRDISEKDEVDSFLSKAKCMKIEI